MKAVAFVQGNKCDSMCDMKWGNKLSVVLSV